MDSGKLFNYAKSPIPTISNSKPHNYIIMPALLSNHAMNNPFSSSPLSSPSSTLQLSSSSSSSSSSPNSFQTKFSHTRSKQAKHRHKNSTRKAIEINTTNTTHTNGLSEKPCKSLLDSNTVALSTCEPTALKVTNHLKNNLNNHIENSICLSKQQLMKQQDAQMITNPFTNKRQVISFDPSSALIVTNSSFNSTLNNLSSAITLSSNLNMNKYLIETDSFVNYVNPHNEDNSNAFSNPNCKILNNEMSSFSYSSSSSCSSNSSSAPNILLVESSSTSNEPNIVRNAEEFIEQMNTNQPTISTTTSSTATPNNVEEIMYTISYPSDWGDINHMLNCFVLAKKLKSNSSASTMTKSTFKLKCSVCNRTDFKTINDLLEHKEINLICKNNMNFCADSLRDVLYDERSVEEEEKSSNRSNKKEARKPVDLRETSVYASYGNDETQDESSAVNEEENEEEVNGYANIREMKDAFDEEEDEGDDENEEEEDDDDEYEKFEYMLFDKSNQPQRSRTLTENKHDRTNGKIAKTSGTKPISKETRPRRKYNKNKLGLASTLNCEKCNKTCRTKAELLVHLHKHKGNEPECWECGKKCASFSNLVSHVQLHTGEKPYTCQFCGKQFTQDAHLTRHLRLHTGERPFVCSICGKNYKDYSYYQTHLRIHRGERLYKCKYCNKEYYDASYYKKHTRLHTGEKPYMCTVCGRQFHRSDYLKLHSFSHTDERPFNCHICGKGFKMNYGLKLHLKSHETNQESDTSANMIEETQHVFNTVDILNCPATNDLETARSSHHLQNAINLNLNEAAEKFTSEMNSNDEIVSFLIEQENELVLKKVTS